MIAGGADGQGAASKRKRDLIGVHALLNFALPVLFCKRLAKQTAKRRLNLVRHFLLAKRFLRAETCVVFVETN